MSESEFNRPPQKPAHSLVLLILSLLTCLLSQTDSLSVRMGIFDKASLK